MMGLLEGGATSIDEKLGIAWSIFRVEITDLTEDQFERAL